MAKYTFYFISPISPKPTADLKTLHIMQAVLQALEMPVQTHFISLEDFNKRYSMDGVSGSLPLGFHVGVPETDDSFHDLDGFFKYLALHECWKD
jgi:hypothetical protein